MCLSLVAALPWAPLAAASSAGSHPLAEHLRKEAEALAAHVEAAKDAEEDAEVVEDQGLSFQSADGNNLLQLDFRGQFRAVNPFDNYPTSEEGLDGEEGTKFTVNRARIKFGGHLLQPWLRFYFEEDLKTPQLLDGRFMIEENPALKLKIGQWKSRFSRERVISSGKQTGVDRSLLNSVFTVDRQQGVSLYGNLEGEGANNFSYWASVLTGNGIGAWRNDDSHPMYLLRLQWNPNGSDLGFSGSDLGYSEELVSSVAVAAVTNRSPYTRFSSSGGGQLSGFEDGVDGQYDINQYLFETAFKYRGWSWEQEAHYKHIDDRVNRRDTTLVGYYVQLGYIPKAWRDLPGKVEIFGRQSWYDPDTDTAGDNNREYTLGMNWFLNGHRNKLTFDVAYLDFDQVSADGATGTRFRVQWDISIY
ncbi:porin [Parahaliea mediterranea]|uniref:porin n=1 Tax=Parahaliea mediterranea TaxID=651086 RepID=UPI001300B598|nr:porin [Parahaliea mediterranea]